MADPWSTSILEMLSRGKVTQAAICQMDGTLLNATPECELTEREVKGIISAFAGPVPMFKIFIGDILYTCQRVLHDTLFGINEAGGKHMTAILRSGVLIIGFANEKAQGSCIHELQSLERQLNRSGYFVPTEPDIFPEVSADKDIHPHRNILV